MKTLGLTGETESNEGLSCPQVGSQVGNSTVSRGFPGPHVWGFHKLVGTPSLEVYGGQEQVRGTACAHLVVRRSVRTWGRMGVMSETGLLCPHGKPCDAVTLSSEALGSCGTRVCGGPHTWACSQSGTPAAILWDGQPSGKP